MSSMQTIDRERLKTDLGYRVSFSRDFIEFTKDDEELLHAAAPLILPVITDIVDGVYEHLFEFSYTKEVFLKRPNDFDDSAVITDITQLTLESAQMVMRKKTLTLWITKLFMGDYGDIAIWEFMDKVGVMHTGQPAFKHRLNKAPLHVDINLLSLTLGWINDVVITTVMNFPRHILSTSRKCGVLKAFNKLIWLQQDLFQRHYVRSDEEAAVNLAKYHAEVAEKEKAGKGKEVEGLVSALKSTSVDPGRKDEEEAREAVEELPAVTVE